MNISHTTVNDAKRDLDALIDRTAADGERIIIVSDGMPQAVVVSLADYARIERTDPVANDRRRDNWLSSDRVASQRRLAQQANQVDAVAAAVEAARKALESGDNFTIDS